jgi:hypothetical protein
MNTKAQAVTELLFSGLSPNTFLLAFASLFADISTEMQYPVLPTFSTETVGANVGERLQRAGRADRGRRLAR